MDRMCSVLQTNRFDLNKIETMCWPKLKYPPNINLVLFLRYQIRCRTNHNHTKRKELVKISSCYYPPRRHRQHRFEKNWFVKLFYNLRCD